jgi:hypothetical protein
MSGWWGSLFSGSDSNLSSAMGNTNNLASATSSQGLQNTSAGSNFNLSILSGDKSKIGQALAPEISAGQDQAQQSKKSTSEFGNRGGGTNASNQNVDAATRGNMTKLVGGLQSGSANSLLSSGSSLLSTSLGADQQSAEMSAQQMKQWSDSIGGLALTSGIGGQAGFLGGIGTG